MDTKVMREGIKAGIAASREYIEKIERILQIASQDPAIAKKRVFGTLRGAKRNLLKAIKDCEKILEEISKGS